MPMNNGFMVELEDGRNFSCKGEESVLHAMLRSRGGPVEHGCCGGGCGICKMQIAAGEYDVFKTMSRAHITAQEEAEGIVLLCCIKPLSDLRLKEFHGEKVPKASEMLKNNFIMRREGF